MSPARCHAIFRSPSTDVSSLGPDHRSRRWSRSSVPTSRCTIGVAVLHDFLARGRREAITISQDRQRRLFRWGVQLLRDARQGRNRLSHRLRSTPAPTSRLHVAAPLLLAGDDGAAALVGVPGRHRQVSPRSQVETAPRSRLPTTLTSTTPRSCRAHQQPLPDAHFEREFCETTLAHPRDGLSTSPVRPSSRPWSPRRSSRPIHRTNGDFEAHFRPGLTMWINDTGAVHRSRCETR